MRRSLAWLIAVPTMLAGTEAAHAVAYRIVFPQASLRVGVLAATGHSYAAWLPLVLALGGAVALAGAGAAAIDVARGRPVRALGPLAFALLPPLAFALQELLELSLHTTSLAWHVYAEPTFLPGLALQVPFALVAFAAARLLLRAAVRLGRLLARPRVAAATPRIPRLRNPIATRLQPDCSASPRAPPLAVGI
ncbi:MAG TPA: hypothetical protein VGK79_10730 [Gaiellaceae bacterium]